LQKTVVKSCGIVKYSNDQAMTSNREGRPLVVVCLHPAQTTLVSPEFNSGDTFP